MIKAQSKRKKKAKMKMNQDKRKKKKKNKKRKKWTLKTSKLSLLKEVSQKRIGALDNTKSFVFLLQ